MLPSHLFGQISYSGNLQLTIKRCYFYLFTKTSVSVECIILPSVVCRLNTLLLFLVGVIQGFARA